MTSNTILVSVARAVKSSWIRNLVFGSAALLALANPAAATSRSETIQQLNDRVSELSVQIRVANSNREREKAAVLREERERTQEQLRELRRLEREEKLAAENQAKREAAERLWVTFPPDKQLCAAIEYHRLDLVKRAMENGSVDLSKPNDHCFFPLGDAAARGHIDIVKFLLEKKSPLAMRVPHFHRLISALDLAASSKHDRTDILNFLKQNGASLNDGRENSAPGEIVASADHKTKELLKAQFNLAPEQLSFGSTLARALEKGSIDNIRWLLREGADPNEFALGRTALMIAVDSNELEKVSALILAGADVNLRGLNQTSALAYAEKRRERLNGRKKAEMDDIIRYLQNQGATRSENES